MVDIKFKILNAFVDYCGGSAYEKTSEGKKKLSEKLEMPRNRLSQIINGNLPTVTFIEMVALAHALDVELKDLYEYEIKEPVKA